MKVALALATAILATAANGQHALPTQNSKKQSPFAPAAVFDAVKLGVPFSNCADLTIGGFCQGISSIHAISRMSDEDRKKYFGDYIAQEFKKDVAHDPESGYSLMRFFATLQFQPVWRDAIKNQPVIYTANLGKKIGGTSMPSDQSLESSNAQILAFHKYLQSSAGHAVGGFGLVEFAKHNKVGDQEFYSIEGGHSLYFYDSKIVGDKVVFSYLDPNYPQKVQTLSYATRTQDTQFSADKGESRYFLNNLIPTQIMADIYKATLDSLKKDTTTSFGKSQYNFLGLGDANAALAPGAVSSPQIRRDLMESFNSGHDLQGLLQEYKDNDKETDIAKMFRKQEELVKKITAVYGEVNIMAQSQLDKGCDTFASYLAELQSKGLRDPKSRSLYLTTLTNMMPLLSLDVAIHRTPTYVAHPKCQEQAACLVTKIMPKLMANGAWGFGELTSSSNLAEILVNWLKDQLPTLPPDQQAQILRNTLAQLQPADAMMAFLTRPKSPSVQVWQKALREAQSQQQDQLKSYLAHKTAKPEFLSNPWLFNDYASKVSEVMAVVPRKDLEGESLDTLKAYTKSWQDYFASNHLSYEQILDAKELNEWKNEERSDFSKHPTPEKLMQSVVTDLNGEAKGQAPSSQQSNR